MKSNLTFHSHSLSFFALLLFWPALSLCQDDWLQNWREATISIGIIDTAIVSDNRTGRPIVKQDGETLRLPYFKVVGTGIMFASPYSNIRHPLLVTAKHVFNDPKKYWDPAEVRIRFTWFANKSVLEYLGVNLLLKNRDGQRCWLAHPDSSVDLAIIPLVMSVEEAGRPTVSTVPFANIATPDLVFEGAGALLFGYPGSVGPEYWTKPIMRHGVIAYVDPYKFGTVPILVDALVFPGNSGGPVFTSPYGITRDAKHITIGPAKFLGIVSSVFRETVEVEKTGIYFMSAGSDTSSSHYRSFNYMGLAVIEPAERVKELLSLIKH